MEKIQVTKDRYRSYRFRGVTRSNFTPSKNSLEYYFAIKNPNYAIACFSELKVKWEICVGRTVDNTIHLIPKTEISSLWPFSVAVQPVSCRTWLETLRTGLLVTWHK